MWIHRLWRRRKVEADMRVEMEFHREARISDLVARGMDQEEAALTARLEFGNAEAHREECRKELGYRPWDELYADLRFATRGMKNNLGFAAATVTILALAIGVNGAFFSLYSNYVLKPLPIRGVDRHFSVLGLDRNARSTSGWSQTEVDALSRSVGLAMEGLYVSDTFQMLAVSPVQRQAMITSVSGYRARISRSNSTPLRPGICMSEITSAYASMARWANASSQEAAVVQIYSSDKKSANKLRTMSSSSTMRILRSTSSSKDSATATGKFSLMG